MSVAVGDPAHKHHQDMNLSRDPVLVAKEDDNWKSVTNPTDMKAFHF